MLRHHGQPTEPPRPIVIYDGMCARCRRWIRWAHSLSRQGQLCTLPLHDRRAVEVAGRSRQELLRAVHVVHPDGAVVHGAEAVRDVLRYLRGGRLFAWLFELPGALWLAKRIYAWAAERRVTCANGDTETDSRCVGVP